MTHIKPNRSQKWGGDWNLGSLISLSKGILSRDSKGMKKQSEQKEAHQPERNVTRFQKDRKQTEVSGLGLNSKWGKGSLKDLQRLWTHSQGSQGRGWAGWGRHSGQE